MNHLLLASVVFVLFAGTFASAETIPSWVKNNAQYWADDSIDDVIFINALEFLISEQIIVIPEIEVADNPSGQIPPWVKNNAQYWAQDAITDLDFINGIQYLITGGIIVIERDDEAPIQLSGIFVNGDFVHQISGSANVGFSGEKTILHLSDDFKTVSGPDLYVYLATDKQAKDHVNLGMIQKFSGL